MERTLSLLILFFSIFTFGQNQTQIPGTKYSMIPPKNFVISTNFSGFQNNETGSSILILDLPAPYSEIEKSFTKDALKSKGMDLISKDIVKYKNSDATLIKVSQKANGIEYLKQILIFGNGTKTTIVNGICPKKVQESENEIYNSLFTITYDEKQTENPLEAVKYSIEISGTNYKLVRSMLGSLLYSEDGKIPSEKGLIIVSNSIGNFSSTDKKQFAIDRLKKLPNSEDAKINSVEKINISDLDGYEIIAEGKKEEVIYQVMLFAANQYFLIVGSNKEDQKESLEIYKKVAKTFKIKE